MERRAWDGLDAVILDISYCQYDMKNTFNYLFNYGIKFRHWTDYASRIQQKVEI